MSRSPLPALLVAAASAVLLTGCSISSITNLVQGKEDVFSIKVGECFNDDTGDSETVEAVKKPACTEEHDNEAFFIYDLEESDFPEYDADAILADADEQCFAPFETFIDATYENTSIDYAYYVPSADSWGFGDREVLCFAYDLNGPVSESLKGQGSAYPWNG